MQKGDWMIALIALIILIIIALMIANINSIFPTPPIQQTVSEVIR